MPYEATRIFVPHSPNGLLGVRLPGQKSWLRKLIQDRKSVKENDLLAAFAFPERQLQKAYLHHLRKLKAQRDQVLTNLEDEQRKLQAKRELARIEAAKKSVQERSWVMLFL